MTFHISGRITKSHRQKEYLMVDEFIVDSITPDFDTATAKEIPSDIEDIILLASVMKEYLYELL